MDIGAVWCFYPWLLTLNEYHQWWSPQNDFYSMCFGRCPERTAITAAPAAGFSMCPVVCVDAAASASGIHCEGLIFTVFIIRKSCFPKQTDPFNRPSLVIFSYQNISFSWPRPRIITITITQDLLAMRQQYRCGPIHLFFESPSPINITHGCSTISVDAWVPMWSLSLWLSEKIKWCLAICCCYDRKNLKYCYIKQTQSSCQHTNTCKSRKNTSCCHQIYLLGIYYSEFLSPTLLDFFNESIVYFFCSLASLSDQMLRS